MADHEVGELYMADYLLYRLNKAEPTEGQPGHICDYRYVEALNLTGPTNNIMDVCQQIQQTLNSRALSVDILAGARFFLKMWRMGHLGPMMLDPVPMPGELLVRKKAFVTEPPNPWTTRYNHHRIA